MDCKAKTFLHNVIFYQMLILVSENFLRSLLIFFVEFTFKENEQR